LVHTAIPELLNEDISEENVENKI